MSKKAKITIIRIPEAEHFASAATSVRLAILYRRLLKIERKLATRHPAPFMDFCEKHDPTSLFFEVIECNDCDWKD